jgi:hypothetical protein
MRAQNGDFVSNESLAYDMFAQTRALVPLRAGGDIAFEPSSGRSSAGFPRGLHQAAVSTETVWNSNTFLNSRAVQVTSSNLRGTYYGGGNLIFVQGGRLNNQGLVVNSFAPMYAAITVSGIGPYDVVPTTGITISTTSFGDDPPDQSPTSRVEEVKQQCLAILARLDNSLARKVSDAVRVQLINLLSPDEWDETGAVPTIDSFGYAVALLAVNNELRAPSITIARTNFVFSFLKNRDRNNAVHLEFEADGWVTFIVSLAPLGRYPKARRAVMTVPFSEIQAHLKLLGVWDWLAT